MKKLVKKWTESSLILKIIIGLVKEKEIKKMAAYFLDYNENNMIEWSNNALLPNESIKGSIMAVYSNVGAKISNGPFFGYFSVTDNNRILVGLTHKNINHIYHLILKNVFSS